jgi:hypothetical protein
MFKIAFPQTFVVSLILFVVHFGLNYFLKSISNADVVLIHVILFLLTLGGYLLILMMKKVDETKIGFTFLAVSTIKLLVAVSLILILFKGFGRPKSIGVHFAGAYFLYIIFLSIKTFLMLNDEIDNKKVQ